MKKRKTECKFPLGIWEPELVPQLGSSREVFILHLRCPKCRAELSRQPGTREMIGTCQAIGWHTIPGGSLPDPENI